MSEERLPLRLRVGWGLGSLPGSALNVMANVLMLRFMTDTLGIAAAVASSLFAAAKVWDAVNDPIIGALSDCFDTRWGRRLPWILSGGILSAFVVVLGFWAPVPTGNPMLVFMAFALVAYATTYSMLMVPYLAMPAEMTANYHGRTQLMSFRVFFSSAGSTLGLGLAPFLLAYWGATRAGHLGAALVVASIAIVATALCVWLLRDAPRVARAATTTSIPLLRQLSSALSNRPFLWLLTAKFTYFTVLAFSVSAFAFFTKHVLKTTDGWLGTFLMIQSATVVLSQPLWLRVARTVGKRTGFMIAGALYGAAHLSWWFAVPGEPVAALFARAMAIGLAGGGTFLFMQAMLPDAIEYDRLATGLERAGIFTGVYVFVEQAASAIGIAVIGVLLGSMGYVEAIEGQRVAQPASAVLGIQLCTSIIPAALMVVSLLAISRYDLSVTRLEALRDDARRTAHG